MGQMMKFAPPSLQDFVPNIQAAVFLTYLERDASFRWRSDSAQQQLQKLRCPRTVSIGWGWPHDEGFNAVRPDCGVKFSRDPTPVTSLNVATYSIELRNPRIGSLPQYLCHLPWHWVGAKLRKCNVVNNCSLDAISKRLS